MKITIRKTTETSGTRFVLDYTPIGGKRVRRFFKTKPEAEKAAQQQRLQARTHGESWLALTATEQHDIVTGYQRLRDLKVNLSTVIDEWLAGKSRNGNGNGAPVKSLALGKAGDLWEKFMLKKKNSPMHAANSRRWVNRFAKGREEQLVADVTTDDVIAYLDKYDGNTYNGNRDAARSFFGWAADEGYAPKGIFDGKRIPKQKIDHEGSEILTVEQVKKALEFCLENRPDCLLYVVIGIFCGCRPSEIDRMTWKMFDLKRGLIHLPAKITKTRRTRLVHMHPTAKAWIEKAKAMGSKLGAELAPTKQADLVPLRDHLGFDAWPSDVMRHSFGSYHLALVHDIGKTAMEMGNTPDIIMAHYFNVVTPEACEAYWAMTPDKFETK